MQYFYQKSANLTDDHGAATADHGSSTLVSIFGTLNELQPLEAASSIIVIIISVVILNYIVEKLSLITKDTPFEALLVAIEHELMIVGCTAFIFKIFINLYPFLSSEWYHALEYADILVPIVAFVFCFQGFLLIVMTILQTNIWNKGYHLLLEEILDQFYDCHVTNDNNQKFFLHRIFCQFMVQEKMRFRIYRLIFCDQYGIIRNSLAFDSYVLRVYEKYLLDIIEIRPLDWLFVIGVVLLNWGRDSLTQTTFFGTCDHDDIHCLNEVSFKSFTVVGFVILFGMIVLSLVSYIYNCRLLTSKGVTNICDYPVFLKGGEEASKVDQTKRKLRCGSIVVTPQTMAEISLRMQMGKIERQNSSKQSSGSGILSWVSKTVRVGSDRIKQTFRSAGDKGRGNKFDFRTYVENNEEEKVTVTSHISQEVYESKSDSRNIIEQISRLQSFENKNDKLEVTDIEQNSINYHAVKVAAADNNNNNDNNHNSTLKSSSDVNNIQNLTRNSNDDSASSYHSLYHKSQKISRQNVEIASNPLGLDETDKKKMTEFESKMEDDIANIFLCSRPDDYFHVVKLSLMVMSLYSGLWLTNFCTVALDLPEHRVEWLLLSLTPVIVGKLLYMYIIKCAALLKAMSFCDTEVIAEVLEQTEASDLLAEHLRDKVLARLNTMGKDPTVELRHLFEELDSTHDHRIDKKELESLLNDMGIQFSRRTWEQMFKRIDRNMDQQVTLDDLFMFIFPDNDIAQIEENVRIKTLQFRIRTFSARYHDNNRNSIYDYCCQSIFCLYFHRTIGSRYLVTKVTPLSSSTSRGEDDEPLSHHPGNNNPNKNNNNNNNRNHNYLSFISTSNQNTTSTAVEADHRGSITAAAAAAAAMTTNSPAASSTNSIDSDDKEVIAGVTDKSTHAKATVTMETDESHDGETAKAPPHKKLLSARSRVNLMAEAHQQRASSMNLFRSPSQSNIHPHSPNIRGNSRLTSSPSMGDLQRRNSSLC